LTDDGPQRAGLQVAAAVIRDGDSPRRILPVDKNIVAARDPLLDEAGVAKSAKHVPRAARGQAAGHDAATVTFRTAGTASAGVGRPCSLR